MDSLIRKLSIGLARTSSRRSFLGSAINGIVTAGIGAIAFFGGERPSFGVLCTTIAGESYGCLAGASCASLSTDNHGCTITISYCDSDPDTFACPEGYSTMGSWVCCCNNRRSRCTDCKPDVGSICVQHGLGGAC